MIMDLEKPFKTIEVIDKDTKQVCKIACMSCIRGHRTTSCGIPVCRSKVFWTVKRPGRPSNSCTCRFNASGVCKCVTAIPKCPHKSRKGEKRSSECRCDEQGRFCCLLEPEHWRKLMALEKPTVQFYPSRETLEAWQASRFASGCRPDTFLVKEQPAIRYVGQPCTRFHLPSCILRLSLVPKHLSESASASVLEFNFALIWIPFRR